MTLDHIDEIIDKHATGYGVEGNKFEPFWSDHTLRAVAEAAYKEGGRKAEAIARECKQQYHSRRDALINARRDFAREALVEFMLVWGAGKPMTTGVVGMPAFLGWLRKQVGE